MRWKISCGFRSSIWKSRRRAARDTDGRDVAGQLIRVRHLSVRRTTQKPAAESRNDFVHKLGALCLKLRESRVWLRMLCLMRTTARASAPLTDECTQLMNIIGKSADRQGNAVQANGRHVHRPK